VPIARSIPIELDGERGDLAAFAVLDDLAERARFAYLVEMDHFIHEKYDFRLLCIRYLASKGWLWFGEELAADRGRRVDTYLQAGDETLLTPLDEPPWFTTGVLANPRQPTSALDSEQRRFMQAVRRSVRSVRWFGFDADSSNGDYLALANASQSYEALRPAMARREQIMFTNIATVCEANPVDKIALMAGSTHLLKDDDSATTASDGAGPGGGSEHSIGHRVAHELTAEPVLAIWLLHGIGTSANPWLPAPGRLAPRTGTLDAKLLATVNHPCLVPVTGDWQRGKITQMHNQVLECDLAAQVDAVVFAPTVTPLRPNHV
jgi:erythromycin esterase-like protein